MGTDGQIFTYTDERAYYFASGTWVNAIKVKQLLKYLNKVLERITFKI